MTLGVFFRDDFKVRGRIHFDLRSELKLHFSEKYFVAGHSHIFGWSNFVYERATLKEAKYPGLRNFYNADFLQCDQSHPRKIVAAVR